MVWLDIHIRKIFKKWNRIVKKYITWIKLYIKVKQTKANKELKKQYNCIKCKEPKIKTNGNLIKMIPK